VCVIVLPKHLKFCFSYGEIITNSKAQERPTSSRCCVVLACWPWAGDELPFKSEFYFTSTHKPPRHMACAVIVCQWYSEQAITVVCSSSRNMTMVGQFHIPVVVGIECMIDCVLVSARDHARGTAMTPPHYFNKRSHRWILFTCYFAFNYAFSSWSYTASVDILLTIMNREACERSDCTHTSIYCPDTCLKGLRETTKSDKMESADRDFNPDLRNTKQ
jgi:hypothetical protein